MPTAKQIIEDYIKQPIGRYPSASYVTVRELSDEKQDLDNAIRYRATFAGPRGKQSYDVYLDAVTGEVVTGIDYY
jgi:predicted small secreted protein